jgi:hypothetical protein
MQKRVDTRIRFDPELGLDTASKDSQIGMAGRNSRSRFQIITLEYIVIIHEYE